MQRKRLGELLIEAGLINEQKLRVALAQQRKWNVPLGTALIDLHLITEEALVKTLSEQLRIPVAEDVDKIAIPSEVLDLLPADLAQRHNVLPFKLDGPFLDVAMADPTNFAAVDELRILTKLDIQPHLAAPHALARAIQKWYLHADVDGLPNIDPSVMEIEGARTLGDRSDPYVGKKLAAANAGAKRAEALWAAPEVTLAPPPDAPTVQELAASLKKREQEMDALQKRLLLIEQLRARDEEIIRQICILLIEKSVLTREEIVKRMNRAG